MSDGTRIEWCDATVNAINGCSLASPGCTNCYAMKQAHRFPVRQGLTMPSKGGMVWTGAVRLSETALLQPLRWRRPRTIFWNAHGDTFHDKVPDDWIDRMFAVMALTPQHKHLVLTKRSARMRDYMTAPMPGRRWSAAAAEIAPERHDERLRLAARVGDGAPLPNVWLGVSVEDQARADERIPDLLATPAAGRFLSCEPLLGPVNLAALRLVSARPVDCLTGVSAEPADNADGYVNIQGPRIDGVIVGGESGPGARPMHPDWARSLRDQCVAARVDFHFKQWGEWAPYDRGQNDSRDFVQPGALDMPFQKFGKKLAGRMLDGVQHDALPWVRGD